VLVMKQAFALLAAVVLALAAAPAQAVDATTRDTDPGAGPIRVHVTACLLANRTHQGPPCAEPQVPADAKKAERVAALITRAWYFIDMQDLDKARAEADRALALDPASLAARHLSARLSLSIGDLPRAEPDIALALKQAPDNADVQATHARLLLSKPANIEALREFQAIILKHPDHLYSREQAAELCTQIGAYGVALANLNYVMERRPSVTLHEQRAQVFLAVGQAQSAVADLSEAIKEEPNRFDLVAERANAYAMAGLDELALRDFDTVLAFDHGAPLYVMFGNDRAKLLAGRALVYVHLHRFDEATDDMVTAISAGGAQAILRTQVLLRGNGFPDVPLDGHDSKALRTALTACFGLNACFQGVMKAI
jgi:Tfp pilus assembly protein PilF